MSKDNKLSRRERWHRSMLEKYGSEEAVKEKMREIAAKSSRNKGGKSYFEFLKKNNPERLKEISVRAATTRHYGEETDVRGDSGESRKPPDADTDGLVDSSGQAKNQVKKNRG